MKHAFTSHWLGVCGALVVLLWPSVALARVEEMSPVVFFVFLAAVLLLLPTLPLVLVCIESPSRGLRIAIWTIALVVASLGACVWPDSSALGPELCLVATLLAAVTLARAREGEAYRARTIVTSVALLLWWIVPYVFFRRPPPLAPSGIAAAATLGTALWALHRMRRGRLSAAGRSAVVIVAWVTSFFSIAAWIAHG